MLVEKKVENVMSGYQEGPIYFAPTFKFNAGTTLYKKSRQPSWTDRIIFRSNDGILTQINYDSNNLVTLSDHRPVFSQFKLAFDRRDQKNQDMYAENRKKVRNSIKCSIPKPPPRGATNKVQPIMLPPST